MSNIYMRSAQPTDLNQIMTIIDQAKALLKADGSSQWQDGHPDRATLTEDIAQHHCWVLIVNGQLAGTATLIVGEEPTYQEIQAGNWADTQHPYATFHRIALSAAFRGERLSDYFFSNLISQAYQQGVRHLRIDTHEQNQRMQHIVGTFGYQYRGIIYVNPTPDGKRLAYELNLD